MLILFLANSFETKGQKKYIQNSKSSYSKKRKVDNEEINNRLKYAESIFDDSISRAVKIVEANLLLAIEYHYKEEEALGYQILGRFNHSLSNYSLASSNYEKAIAIIKDKNNPEWYIEILREAALSYEKNKSYNKAITFHRESLKLLSTKKKLISTNRINTKPESILYHQWKIAELELKLNKTEEALKSFKKLLSSANSLSKKEYEIKANIGLGKVEMKKKNFSAAQVYLEKAQLEAEKEENDKLANQAFDLLAVLFEKQENLNKSISVQKRAFKYNNARGNINPALNNSNTISQNYLRQGRTKEAMDVIKETKPLLDVKDNSKVKREFLNTASQVYQEEGLEKKAQEAKEKYQTLVDSFNYNEQQKQLIEEAKNEFLVNVQNKMLLMEKDRELNEQTIELLKKDQVIQNETIKRQQTITLLLILGLIIISVLGFLLLRNNRQRQKNNKLLILKSLRTQMNPHFIFNSLNSVNSFIAKKDEKSANKYLAEFSKLMREVLECSQEDFIPLAKEIELLKRYLKLEYFRFKDEFEYEFHVDEKIVLDNYQIPPMLIQPFVENAIWHGLRYKKEKGKLSVHFTQETDYLKIMISDDGIGRRQSLATKTTNQKKMKSTGISNVENRLEIIKNVFKKKLEIDIRDLRVGDEPGTQVELKLY